MPNSPMRLPPSPSADNGKLDGFVIASTISEMRRDSRAKAARASYGFWSTGDEALLKRAFAENFADRAVWPPTRRQRLICGPAGAWRQKRSRYDHPQNDLGEVQRLAPVPRDGARIVSVL